MQMCTRAKRLYPRHLFVKNRLGGVRSCSSCGASVSLGERANISAGHGEYLPLPRYFQQLHVRACAARMPRYHGGGVISGLGTHESGLLLRVRHAPRVNGTSSFRAFRLVT